MLSGIPSYLTDLASKIDMFGGELSLYIVWNMWKEEPPLSSLKLMEMQPQNRWITEFFF